MTRLRKCMLESHNCSTPDWFCKLTIQFFFTIAETEFSPHVIAFPGISSYPVVCSLSPVHWGIPVYRHRFTGMSNCYDGSFGIFSLHLSFREPKERRATLEEWQSQMEITHQDTWKDLQVPLGLQDPPERRSALLPNITIVWMLLKRMRCFRSSWLSRTTNVSMWYSWGIVSTLYPHMNLVGTNWGRQILKAHDVLMIDDCTDQCHQHLQYGRKALRVISCMLLMSTLIPSFSLQRWIQLTFD